MVNQKLPCELPPRTSHAVSRRDGGGPPIAELRLKARSKIGFWMEQAAGRFRRVPARRFLRRQVTAEAGLAARSTQFANMPTRPGFVLLQVIRVIRGQIFFNS